MLLTTAPLPATITARGNSLQVGADNNISQFFNGSLDEVRIYNRALTAQEVQDDRTIAGGADTIAPSVTINQAAGQADPTSASPINFTVTFSETVTGFTASDISFAGSTAGGTLTAAVTGTGPTYNVAVSGMTGTGNVVVSVPAGAATDAAGNASLASTSTDNTVAFTIIDTIAPTVQSINRVGTTPTNAASVSWTVLFSESVTGVDASDFALVTTGAVTGATITTVSGSGSQYTVTANTGTGNGTLGLNLVDNDTILDTSANRLGGTGPGNGNFTGQSYTIDKTAPTVTINQAAGQADPTSASPINFTVTFSETVTGFTASDISFAGSTAGGTLTAAVTGTGPTYNVAVSGMTGTGNVVVSVPAGAATDAAGNASLASTSTDNTVAYNAVAPAADRFCASECGDTANQSICGYGRLHECADRWRHQHPRDRLEQHHLQHHLGHRLGRQHLSTRGPDRARLGAQPGDLLRQQHQGRRRRDQHRDSDLQCVDAVYRHPGIGIQRPRSGQSVRCRHLRFRQRHVGEQRHGHDKLQPAS